MKEEKVYKNEMKCEGKSEDEEGKVFGSLSAKSVCVSVTELYGWRANLQVIVSFSNTIFILFLDFK